MDLFSELCHIMNIHTSCYRLLLIFFVGGGSSAVES